MVEGSCLCVSVWKHLMLCEVAEQMNIVNQMTVSHQSFSWTQHVSHMIWKSWPCSASAVVTLMCLSFYLYYYIHIFIILPSVCLRGILPRAYVKFIKSKLFVGSFTTRWEQSTRINQSKEDFVLFNIVLPSVFWPHK